MASEVRLSRKQTAIAVPTAINGDVQSEHLAEFWMGDSHPEFMQAGLVHATFIAAAARFPQRRCLQFEEKSLSYFEVEQRSLALAQHLLSLGVGSGVTVGIMLEPGFDMIISMLATLRAGGCYLPCDPSYPNDRLAIYLEDGGAAVMLVQPSLEARAQTLLQPNVKVFIVDESVQKSCGTIEQEEATQPNPEDPAYIIFTSGSTGRPKGVVVPHRGLQDLIPSVINLFSLTENDVIMMTNSINFDVHINQLFPPLAVGATVVIPKSGGSLDAKYIVDLIVKYKMTGFMQTVPTLALEYVKELKARKINSYEAMRAWGVGGENVPHEVVRQMQEIFPNLTVFDSYGPTEATVITINHPIPRSFDSIPIGRPDPNVHAYVVDSNLQPVGVGVEGELLLSGPRLALGYAGRPELTSEAFIPNPCLKLVRDRIPADMASYYSKAYRTGDLVRWRSDKNLEFLGRIDRQVKISGVRIELGEVEAALGDAPGVQHAIAMTRKDSKGRDRLVGYVIPSTVSSEAVLEYCTTRLLRAMIPSVVVTLDAFPLLPSGKLHLAALPDPVAWARQRARITALQSNSFTYADLNEVEEAVQEAWGQVLGSEETLPLDTDFFAEGGSSISALRANAELQRALHLMEPPSISLVYDNRTIRATAAAIRRLLDEQPLHASASIVLRHKLWDGNERPLSTAQEQMFAVAAMIDPEYAAAYAVPVAYRIQGPLNFPALQSALAMVVERHEVLRFRYVVHPDSSLRGFVAHANSFKIYIRELSVPDESSSLTVALRTEASAPFDLHAGPLIRAALFRCPTKDIQYFSITMHHAISDGWSIDIICQEISTAYASAVKGEDPHSALPPLLIQYGDYAEWHRRLARKSWRKSLDYWVATLTGAPEALTLQTDRPRPSIPTYAGSVVQGPRLSPELLRGLRSLAVSTSVSPSAPFLAAFHALLARMAVQDDVVVGVPVSERKLADLQPLIGCFINEVAVRAVIDPAAPFSDLVRSVHVALAAAQQHSLVAFSEVVKALGVGGGTTNPLFQVMFEFLDEEEPTLHLPAPLTITSINVRDLGASQMDITLEVSGKDGNIRAEYSTEIFNRDTITRLLECYIALLEAAVADPHAPTGCLEILTPEHRRDLDLLSAGPENGHHLAGPLVHQQFAEQAALRPYAKCLIYKGDVMTYGEVYSAVTGLAARLRAAGVRRGERVGVMLERSFSLVIAILAAFESGGAYLPLDPGYPPSRLAVYIEDAEPLVILTHMPAHPSVAAALEELPPGVRRPAVLEIDTEQLLRDQVIENLRLPSGGDSTDQYEVDALDLAAVLFTSGSTGRPKGVELIHAGLRAAINGSYVEMFSTGPGDVYALTTTINFDPHLGNTLGALTCGAALAILPQGEEIEANRVAELFVEARVTIAEQAPSVVALWEPALEAVADKLELRVLNMGGEATPLALATRLQRKIKSINGGIYNTYGPTEFTICSNSMLIESGATEVTLGPPDPNVRAYVVDPGDITKLQPVGVPGELLLSGPRLARGYIGQPELTTHRFVPNPYYRGRISLSSEVWYQKVYRTGDLVSWTSTGSLRFLGRIDRQVKIDGVRIELGEVESALTKAPGVTHASVTTTTLLGGRKVLVGVITPETLKIEDILAHCRQYVLSAAVPAGLAAVEALPLRPNGKVDTDKVAALGRAAMGQSNGGNNDDQNYYVPPATDLESRIQRVWMEILGLEDEVSVTLDFFHAGGSSLRAGILTARLRTELSLPFLPATMIYTAKTIRAMAETVQGMIESNAAKSKKRLNAEQASQGPHLSADDIVLEMLASQSVPRLKLPYWLYLIVQYVMLSLTLLLLPVVWGALLSALLTLQPKVGWWLLIPIWPAMQLAAMLGYIVLMIVLKWVLVQRLRPGVFPVHGWMYARWVTMRALQQQAKTIFMSPLRRTPLLPMLLKALGANVESVWDTIVDSTLICDFDLITIGKGAQIYHEVLITGAFVVPAGYLGNAPVLVMSPVVIGKKCHLGYKAVISAGTTIPDYHNLKPHASRAHPGDAPVAGPLSDHPHFTPEEHLPLFLAALGSIFNYILISVKEIPSLALSLYLITTILGKTPALFGGSATLNDVIIVSSLFTVFFSWLNPNVSMWLHAIIMVVWKWIAVGRLKPGRVLTSSRWGLLSYAVLRRMVEDPIMVQLQDLLSGTAIMGSIYRLMGAKIGRQAFMGGLTCFEFDALKVEDYASFGSDSHCFTLESNGEIIKTTVRQEATVGNSAVLYPGSDVGRRAVVGNDTIVCANRVLPRDVRLQGGIQYTVDRRGWKAPEEAEEGLGHGLMSQDLGLPSVVTMSADGVAPIHLPWWHNFVIIFVLMLVGPASSVAMWLPVSLLATAIAEVHWWLVPFAYVPAVGLGAVLVVLWLRFLLEVTGIRRLWAAGSASVYDLRAQIVHAHFYGNKVGLDVFKGTPFSVFIHRLLGFRVGEGAILLGVDTPESKLIKIGAGSVVEFGAMLDGHYLEFQRFIYHKTRLGERAWVQEGARLMPATVMKNDSRILPGSMVLPGDVLEERMVWSGMPAEPLSRRPDPKDANTGRRRLLRAARLSSSARRYANGRGDNGILASLDTAKKW